MDVGDPTFTPDWVRRLLDAHADAPPEDAALMDLAVALAGANVEHGGGPFGAVVGDEQRRVVAVGWNSVIPSHDSTAHAEIVAIRRAQRALRTHSLEGMSLYASCEPCIQCFGAIYWSGVAVCYAAATREDAEEIGFDEGPMDEGLWERARHRTGLRHVARFRHGEQALAPLRAYAAREGIIY